jgi:hypothetical protein
LEVPVASSLRTIIVLALPPCCPSRRPAQTAGTLRVTVLDPSGLVIAGATVAIVEARREAVTDESGLARIDGLAEGRYTVRVQADDLTDVVHRDVPVAGGRRRAWPCRSSPCAREKRRSMSSARRASCCARFPGRSTHLP